KVIKRYKTFLATWRPAGGLIRVVLVDEPAGGGVLLHRGVGGGGGPPGGDRRARRPGVRRPRGTGGRGGGPAARWGWGRARVGVDVCPAWGGRLERAGGRTGAPAGLAGGHAGAPAEPRREAAGVAACAAGRGNPCGPMPRGDRDGDSGRRRAAAQPGGLTCMK